MNKKALKGWMKHGDFILLDIICLQISFVLAYWMNIGFHNPYTNQSYFYQAMILLVSQLFVIVFSSSYRSILRRKRFDEMVKVCRYILTILIISLLFLFIIHQTSVVSRMQFGLTSVIFVVVDYLIRQLNKKRIFRFSSDGLSGGKKSIILITSSDLLTEAINKLTGTDRFHDYFISGAVLLDSQGLDQIEKIKSEKHIPVIPFDEGCLLKISRNWIDEAFILQPDHMPFPTELMNGLMKMGITVDYTMSALNDDRWPVTDVRKLGEYKVLSNNVHFAANSQLMVKRVMDIVGGIIGCLLTGVIFVFIAPIIYLKSPGPIFFSQDRIGKNGKIFKMYKFRSMYMDAEERKAALMAKNNIADGMMFKMDDDPRIIGSEKKDKNGNPKGIGNFIRKTSLDEFPQFWNVLKGDMSLVGTRPPTKDEWQKYELHHRARMGTKPGITGMWQVSGRSTITDFEEVVKLDQEYINNWSLLLDLKILLKTVEVVVRGSGAK